MQLNVYMNQDFADELADAAAKQTKRTGKFHTRQDMLKVAWRYFPMSRARGNDFGGTVTAKAGAKKGGR
jgi:hypothetical protein